MDNKELLLHRAKIFHDAVQHKNTDRVPHAANVWTWKIFDAGYQLSEAIYNYDKMYDAVDKFLSNYRFDAVMDLGTRNPMIVKEAFGEKVGKDGWYYIDDNEGVVGVNEPDFMTEQDYPDFIADTNKFLYEKILARKCNFDGKDNAQKWLAAAKAQLDFREYNTKITKHSVEDFGNPTWNSPYARVSTYDFGHEYLFNTLRGIKGLSIDMRRRPALVKEACDAIFALWQNPKMEIEKQGPHGINPTSSIDRHVSIKSHMICQPKQFAEYIFPYLKKWGEHLEDMDRISLFFLESEGTPFYDMFSELPKGRFIYAIELDEIHAFAKGVPSAAILGGLPVHCLNSATKEECVDYAKSLVNDSELAGRFVLSCNKMLSYRNDCKRENLHALCDYMEKQ